MLAAAPSIRKLARDLGIDLTRVRGCARGGRIVLEDVRAYIQRLQRLAAQPREAARGSAAPTAPVAKPAEQIDFSKWGPVERKPLTPLRQVIARRMTENWNAIPHVTQFEEADITALNALRKKYAPAYEQHGARLTLTCFALKAVVAALKKHPVFNSSLDEAAQEIVFKQYYHIGIAVDTEAGLIVPVIRDVDKKNSAATVEGTGGTGEESPRPQSSGRGTERRHLHHFQPGRNRRRAFHADRQQARGGDPRSGPRSDESRRA